MRKIRLSKASMDASEKKALSEVIDDCYLGMGSFVQKFEELLKEYLGADFVECVNSGTSALHLALMAIGLRPQDEVLVQSLTFVGSFQAVSACGAVPVPCEVLPETITIDLEDAKKKLTGRTRAIMPVHYSGGTGDLDAIYKFARDNRLRVIEDAAHAFGGKYKGKKIGSTGDIVCFSFDGIKNITSGEGGAVVTNDAGAAGFVRNARLLGINKDTEKRYKGERSWEFDVFHQGYRYHMSNLFAGIGIAQLKKFEERLKPARQNLAKRYHSSLSGLKDIRLVSNDYNNIVPHIFPIRVINDKRDELKKYLSDNGIECGVHYLPNHLLSFYSRKDGQLPVTEKIYSELLTIPLHPELSFKDQDYVIDKIKKFFDKRRK